MTTLWLVRQQRHYSSRDKIMWVTRTQTEDELKARRDYEVAKKLLMYKVRLYKCEIVKED